MTEERPLILADLSWPELQKVKDQVQMVLIPVGSHEQHGPNSALNTDTALAAAVCRRVSQALYPQVLVAPAIPWGISYHHMTFPGTITLHPDTLLSILRDVVRSLYQHGFQRSLLVNGHAGNRHVVNEATVRIRQEIGVPFIGACSYFDGVPGSVGHASKVETSLAMYLAPETVKTDSLADGDLTGFRPELKLIYAPFPVAKRSRNGPLDVIEGASAQYGRELAEAAIASLVKEVKYIIAEGLTQDV